MERYDRQIRAFGRHGQSILRGLTVAVVGAGGIGSVVFLLLVRLGVGRIFLVDDDVVELSNLNRLAGATLKDAEKKRPKVRVLAEHAARIDPAIEVMAIQESILEPRAQERVKCCDAIFGCTDNQGSRWVLNELAARHLIPYFDTGVGIAADCDHNIEHAGGQVRVVVPGMGCLNCIQGIDIDIAGQEMRPEADRQVAIQRGYIAGANVTTPAVASLDGSVASLAVTEFMAFATGFRPVRRFVGYDFMKATVLTYTFPLDPDCYTCSPVGSLAIGDHGKSLPVELLIDEPEPQHQGESHMNSKTTNAREAIAQLLSHAKHNGLAVDGSAEGRWFLIKQVRLGRPLNRPVAPVMVKFFGENADPVVFLPDRIQIAEDSTACPNFLASTPCLKGWKALCPHMFQDVGDQLLEFIACLCGFLANPRLCGCMGCPGRDVAENVA